MLLSFGAMAYLKSTFAKASQVPVASGMTGAQAAQRILQWAGINDVEIVEGEGFLGDHYDPINKKLVLSPENFEGSSAANVGVAAHECGHALQHQQHYAPLHIRMGAVYATNFASQLVFWVPMIAIFTHIISMYTAIWIAAAGHGHPHALQPDHAARSNSTPAPGPRWCLQQLGIVRPGPEAAAVNSTPERRGTDLRRGLHRVAAPVPLLPHASFRQSPELAVLDEVPALLSVARSDGLASRKLATTLAGRLRPGPCPADTTGNRFPHPTTPEGLAARWHPPGVLLAFSLSSGGVARRGLNHRLGLFDPPSGDRFRPVARRAVGRDGTRAKAFG